MMAETVSDILSLKIISRLRTSEGVPHFPIAFRGGFILHLSFDFIYKGNSINCC